MFHFPTHFSIYVIMHWYREEVNTLYKDRYEMYLTYLFLDLLGPDHTEEKAVQAAIACNAIYQREKATRAQLREFWECARDYPLLKELGLSLIEDAEKAYPR